MATQTTYPDIAAAAVVGAQATMRDADIVSRAVETAAGIAFGSPVMQGTADKQVGFFTAGTVYGVAMLDRSAVGLNPATGVIADDTFGLNESARIMVKGDIWLTAAVAVAAGDPVYVRPSNGTWQNDATNSGVLVVGARWDTSAAIAGLAVAHFG